MFLIEYAKGLYVDGEQIDFLRVTPECVYFCTRLVADTEFVVQEDFAGTFLSDLQSLNDNITNLGSRVI